MNLPAVTLPTVKMPSRETPMLIEHGKTGMLLVLVPAGRFLAGDTKFEVELPASYIGLHPVTNQQYGKFVRESGHRVPEHAEYGEPAWKDGKYPEEKAEHPVVCVSWDDAQAYCAWAGLRLPGELEWEKAARGVDGWRYPWGEVWDATKCRSKKNKGNETTASVWSHAEAASVWGVLQMSGNVWEWCGDWHEKSAYERYKRGDLKPPMSGQSRVLRGGSWFNRLPESFAASYRSNDRPGNCNINRGFRCVAPGGV